jgi:hypothetical protein
MQNWKKDPLLASLIRKQKRGADDFLTLTRARDRMNRLDHHMLSSPSVVYNYMRDGS